LLEYRDMLDQEFSNLHMIIDPKERSLQMNYLNHEYEWTQKMIHKVGIL